MNCGNILPGILSKAKNLIVRRKDPSTPLRSAQDDSGAKYPLLRSV